ncbi:plasmid mobilization protein [Aureimonas endophytica]|nr:plasmid mobilization relaxosome protein MobC [Aureimonas endophytica]
MSRTSTTTTLRLSADERAALDRAAETAGLGPSAFARLAVVKAAGGKPTPARRRRNDLAQAVARALGELARIGSNVNQVARRSNLGRPAEAAELAAIRADLERSTLALLALREQPPA